MIDRRRFVAKAAGGTTAAGAALLLGAPSLLGGEVAASWPEPIGRVRLAMLAMQRYAWEQGVAAQALLELGDVDTMVLMAKDAVLRQLEDGRLAVVSENHGVTDPAANGEAVLRAAAITGDRRLAAGAERMRDYLLKTAPRTADGTLHHVDHEPQVWVDSMYMAPPFLAAIGEHREALRQIDGMVKLLWDDDAKLFSQIWDDGGKRFIRRAHWGVGNGWAAAGICRVIGHLPSGMADDRKRLAALVRDIVAGCLRHQRRDGLFHDVVDDPTTFVETNLAQMLAYTIFRGVASGWLDRALLGSAKAMKEAAAAKVDAYGLVQDVCGAPDFESAGTAPEGQAFCILMYAAERDLGDKDAVQPQRPSMKEENHET